MRVISISENQSNFLKEKFKIFLGLLTLLFAMVMVFAHLVEKISNHFGTRFFRHYGLFGVGEISLDGVPTSFKFTIIGEMRMPLNSLKLSCKQG
jgi:hypothetical protein